MKSYVEIRDTMDGKLLTAFFSNTDIIRLRLDSVDSAMLAEPAESGADLLLDAEILFRRMQEQL